MDSSQPDAALLHILSMVVRRTDWPILLTANALVTLEVAKQKHTLRRKGQRVKPVESALENKFRLFLNTISFQLYHTLETSTTLMKRVKG